MDRGPHVPSESTDAARKAALIILEQIETMIALVEFVPQHASTLALLLDALEEVLRILGERPRLHS